MKKIAILTNNLDIGGIERAILNYLKLIDKSKYEITLFLDDGKGIYFHEVDNVIKVVNINTVKEGNVLYRKFINFFKLIYFSFKYFHKFDFAASFTTTVKSNFLLARLFSTNNAIWYHGDYFNDAKQAKEFLKYSHSLDYKKVVFVSQCLKEKYLKYTDKKQELFVINNPIDYEMMINKSKAELNIEKRKVTLLNVGRHEELSKKLSVLLKVCAKLLNEGYDFDLWMVGDGKDKLMYEKMIEQLHIDNNVKMFGKQNNVYPFYKKADAVVLTSAYEGNPVVFSEAKVMNIPVISTDVSDAKSELDGYGIVCQNNEEAIYEAIKSFLNNGYKINKSFDPLKFNNDIMNKLDEVINCE